MQMVCPECEHVESFDKLPMRLQTCPACSRSDSYMTVPILEVRQPIPQPLPGGRAVFAGRGQACGADKDPGLKP